MNPRGPKENRIATEMVNGGEISGSRVAASSAVSRRGLKAARALVKANRKASTVPPAPTSRASSRLLAKARWLLGSTAMVSKGVSVSAPSSVNTRASRHASG